MGQIQEELVYGSTLLMKKMNKIFGVFQPRSMQNVNFYILKLTFFYKCLAVTYNLL